MAKFTDVFSDQTKLGYKIPTSEYLPEGKFPIIDQGHGQIAGYTNLESGAFENVPVIIFGDHTRAVKYVNTPFFLGADGVKVLKSKIKDTDYKYLFYFLQTAHIPNTGYNRHFKWLKELEIPLPPISEQRRIASILDKLTDLIAKRRAQLEKLDLLVKSRFVEMFGTERDFSKWNIAKVEDVAEVCVGVVIKPSQYYAEVGIKAFRSLNIGVMNVKNSDWVYFSEEGHLKNAKSTVHEGDILVVRSGAPGTACVVTKEYDGCNAVDIIIARPNSKKINSVFLAAFTNYPHGMNQIQKGTGGAAQQHFNVGQYKTMQIILPPLDLQNEFALYFHQTETTKSNIQKSLETLETLKKALMQEYFG